MKRAWITSSLSLTLLVAIMGVSVISVAEDDFASAPAKGWAGFGTTSLPMIDASGNYQIKTTRGVEVTTNLLDHNKASDGTKFAHVHWETDYSGATEIAGGNRFFDWIFGASDSPAKTSRSGDCTDKQNCHASALTDFIKRGTWGYWIQDPTGPFGKETDAKAKSSVVENDVLLYGSAHSTGVKESEPGEPGSIVSLRWKAGFSGIYAYATTGFDTPKNVPGSAPEEGKAKPTDWTWDTDAMGAEAALNNLVRRKKP